MGITDSVHEFFVHEAVGGYLRCDPPQVVGVKDENIVVGEIAAFARNESGNAVWSQVVFQMYIQKILGLQE